MKSHTEQEDSTYVSNKRKPKRKFRSRLSIVPEIDIFPFDDNLSDIKNRKKKGTVRNNI